MTRMVFLTLLSHLSGTMCGDLQGMVSDQVSDLGPTVRDLFDMTGMVALVTGGSRGLGLDEASAIVDLGAQVVVTSRSLQDACAGAARLSQRAKVPAVGMALDVTSEIAVSDVFTQVASRWGRLDVLVNNAGGVPETDGVSIFDRRLEHWNEVVAVNLTGPFLCTKAASTIMRQQGSGSIINISSNTAIVGRDQRIYEGLDMRSNPPDYVAAKAGLLGLTYETAASLGPFGIRVNAIVLGGFKRDHAAEFVRRYGDRTALGRMGREGYDIKGIIALLASRAGAFITGASVVVDGGFSIFK